MRIAILVCCCICYLAAGETAFDPVISVDEKAHTRLETESGLMQRRRDFFRRVFLGAYERRGRKDDPLAGQIREFLARAATAWGSYSNATYITPDVVHAATALQEAGCTDPLALYLIGRARQDAGAAALAAVYPALIELGYDGMAREMAAHSLLQSPGRIDDAKRRELLRAETAHRFDWLLDPAFDAFPEGITEQLEDLGHVPQTTEARLAYWQPLLATPSNWPKQHIWRLDLVQGIAHLACAEASQGIWEATRKQLADPARHPGIRADPHFQEALRALRRADQSHSADGQASAWLIRAAIADPTITDVPALLGRAISRQSCMMTASMNYGQWLEVHRPDDPRAIREAAIVCTAFGNQQAPIARGIAIDVLRWIRKHRQQAKAVVDDPRYYRALAEYRYGTVRITPLGRGTFQANAAEQAVLLWLMGHAYEAGMWAEVAGDEALQRNLAWYLPDVPLAGFRSAIAADPVVKVLNTTDAMPSDQACRALEPFLIARQPALDDVYAMYLAYSGKRQEAVARIEQTIAWAGRCGRDIMVGHFLYMGNPTPADQDAAFDRFTAYPGDLNQYIRIRGLAYELGRMGAYDRFVALVKPWMLGQSNAFDAEVAWLQLVTVDAALPCAETLHKLRKIGAFNEGYTAMWSLRQTLAARLAKRPDLAVPPEELRRLIGQKHRDPEPRVADALLGFMVGDIDRATAMARCAGTKYPDVIHCYLMFDAIANQQFPLVQESIAALLAHTEDAWQGERSMANRVKAWLAEHGRQAPQQSGF